MRNYSILSLIVLSFSISASAGAPQSLLRGSDITPISLSEGLAAVKAGDIVVVGENHDLKGHQDKELQIMQELRRRGLVVSVGMEFYSYPYQTAVDEFRAGKTSEADFLKAVNWGGNQFDLYREQTLFPRSSEGGQTLALNAPMALTAKVAKNGLSSLTPQEQLLLPPNLSLGRDSYKQRFVDYMSASGHVPSHQAIENYFAAQSIWDETMAWRAAEFIKAHPQQVLVIVVGEFHVQYGGGLPDKLSQRTKANITTISLLNTRDMTVEEMMKEINPSPAYGVRADLLWCEDEQSSVVVP